MAKITLVNIDVANNHKKFWTIKVDGCVARCTWGRIGSWEQSKEFEFDTDGEARRFAAKKVDSKLDGGYVQVGR